MAGDAILVTGAAGFIGQAVALRLAREGFEVRAGVRRTGLPAGLAARAGVTQVPCDLDRPETVSAAMDGVGLVVHAAYGAEAEMVPHCARLLAAMTAGDVPDLIQFSSIAVYGRRVGLIAEDDPAEGSDGPYGEAKIGCEGLIRDWTAAASGRRALLLRPGVVYGRGSALWVDKMAERIRRGAWGDFGAAAAGAAPLIHVDDVAEAALRAVTLYAGGRDGAPEGATPVNLVGPETPSWRDYFAALAQALGAPALKPVGPSELALRRALAVPAKVMNRFGLPAPARFALAPAAGELALFRRDATFSTARARDLLGFEAKIGLAEGLRRSVGAGQPKA